MKIKRNDTVLVTVGDDKGLTPRRVTQVLDGGERLIVEGVNLVYKHVRRGHPKSPQGGRLRMEMPIRSSNVVYYCESCQKGSRLGLRYADDGSKERFCKRCGTSVGRVSPPRETYAEK
ncbi:50S ribosomal protein L24 [Maioricimonas rarisocia]|uniref:Large ribosomal subunit protein uL24 n=1 Tax=Maioricimonas rarisocia TaxID=2528026 RepID=A0A517ZBI6_9PLAN|nr:50S ribosomal protein L24 [Maioricimonas rarisocia]QDU39853.1 50S ribosomal protein L24 [Maioricimonas rarisocia]